MKPSTVHLKLIALALAVTAMLVPSAGASPATVETVQAISAAPLADPCTPPGDLETDTRIAVNPDNPNNIVASWNGIASGATLVAVSRDRGQNWKQVVVPRHAGCSGAEPESFAKDPGIAFDADKKTLYVASLGGSLQDPARLLVSRSRNEGEPFLGETFLEGDPKEVDGVEVNPHTLWLTADPKVPGRAYMVWTVGEDRCKPACTAAFSRTTNSGDSWSGATAIYEAPARYDDVGNHVLRVLPDGTLLHVFAQRPGAGEPYEIVARRCEADCDEGASWSPTPPIPIGTACDSRPTDPDTLQPVHSFPGPSLAVAGGTAYVAWHTIGSCDGHSASQVLIASSTDRGKTWSQPHDLKSEVEPDDAIEVTLATAAGDTVGITYYDFRNDRPLDEELTTDVWFAHSHDAGATWTEVQLGRFDARTVFDPIQTSAFGVTDFNGLAALPRGFAASFVQTDQTAPAAVEPPTDIFFARLSVPR